MAKKTQKRLPRRREEFTYGGYRLEELQKMTVSDLIPVMPARARRKVKRGLTRGEENLLQQFRHGESGVKTHLRDMIVMPEMVGREVLVYNGKEFMKVEVQPEALFHYLGEFALTRKRVNHGSAGIGATRSSKYVPLK
ncbi:MAG: 30S ribosomal protein S19 [Methanomicrobiales archaeon]|jgi:small subunit ribosomal protein S19|nr:30S ribosomal protein S19 [Methanomicrobiales archaeon]